MANDDKHVTILSKYVRLNRTVVRNSKCWAIFFKNLKSRFENLNKFSLNLAIYAFYKRHILKVFSHVIALFFHFYSDKTFESLTLI